MKNLAIILAFAMISPVAYGKAQSGDTVRSGVKTNIGGHNCTAGKPSCEGLTCNSKTQEQRQIVRSKGNSGVS